MIWGNRVRFGSKVVREELGKGFVCRGLVRVEIGEEIRIGNMWLIGGVIIRVVE